MRLRQWKADSLCDAALLCRQVIAARDGRMTALEAVHRYAMQMIDDGFQHGVTSRQQIAGSGLAHKPVPGWAMLTAMRLGLRVVNHLPPAKRRLATQLQRSRGANRREDDIA